jgi:hypothetical protein
MVFAEMAWESADTAVETNADTVSNRLPIDVTLEEIAETRLLTEVTAAEVAAWAAETALTALVMLVTFAEIADTRLLTDVTASEVAAWAAETMLMALAAAALAALNSVEVTEPVPTATVEACHFPSAELYIRACPSPAPAIETPIKDEMVFALIAWESAEATVEIKADTASNLPAIEMALADITEALLLSVVILPLCTRAAENASAATTETAEVAVETVSILEDNPASPALNSLDVTEPEPPSPVIEVIRKLKAPSAVDLVAASALMEFETTAMATLSALSAEMRLATSAECSWDVTDPEPPVTEMLSMRTDSAASADALLALSAATATETSLGVAPRPVSIVMPLSVSPRTISMLI